MQISLPILIVHPFIQNPVINFCTHLWPVKSNALGYTFALRILFHLLQCRCNTCTNMINNDMIHSISSHDHIGSSILTSLALHRCFGPSVPIHHSTCPSHSTGLSSQVMSWSSPPWSHDLMSCLMCNELLHHHIYELCFSPSWYMLLTHMYLWTNHLCISHKHN